MQNMFIPLFFVRISLAVYLFCFVLFIFSVCVRVCFNRLFNVCGVSADFCICPVLLCSVLFRPGLVRVLALALQISCGNGIHMSLSHGGAVDFVIWSFIYVHTYIQIHICVSHIHVHMWKIYTHIWHTQVAASDFTFGTLWIR